MGDEREDERRVTRLETMFDSLDHKVDKVDASVEGIHAKLDTWAELFVPRKEIEAKFDTVYSRIRTLEEAARSKRNNAPFWVAAAIAVAALIHDMWPKA